MFVERIPSEKAQKSKSWTLRQLCMAADVPCRATGAFTQRRVFVAPGRHLEVTAEASPKTAVLIRMPYQMRAEQARQALGVLAYQLMDPVARESIRGAAWAKFAPKRGRPRTGKARNNRERQRRHQSRFGRLAPHA